MRYLRLFEDFEVGATDQPDVKLSKERLNTIQAQIKEYKIKKSAVDTLYASTNDVKLIEDGLLKLLGNTDAKQGVDRNPFLVEYVSVVKLKSDIENMDKANIDDKIKLDDFRSDLNNTTDPQMKTSLNVKIADINTRMQDRVRKLSEIKSELDKSSKAHNDRMLKTDKDIKEFSKKITNI